MSFTSDFQSALASSTRTELLRQLAEEHRYLILSQLLHAPLSPSHRSSLVDLSLADFTQTRQIGRICRFDFLIENYLPAGASPKNHLGVLLCAERELRSIHEISEDDQYSLSFALSKDDGKLVEGACLRLLVLAEGRSADRRFALELRQTPSSDLSIKISEPLRGDRFSS